MNNIIIQMYMGQIKVQCKLQLETKLNIQLLKLCFLNICHIVLYLYQTFSLLLLALGTQQGMCFTNLL